MNLYISDTHFGHRDIIRFDKRPFMDIEQMDNTLIWLWNDRVSKDDDVWIIGDFACGGDKPSEYYLKQLKGRKHLIVGNHDKMLVGNSTACGYFKSIEERAIINDKYKGEDVTILLQHYPDFEWVRGKESQYHIYGHIHNWNGKEQTIMRNKEGAYNAGCMLNDYTPTSLWGLAERRRRE